MSDCRIQVRIGEHEFSAEGPAEIVQAQYAEFLKRIGSSPSAQAPVGEPPYLWNVFETGKEGTLRVLANAFRAMDNSDYLILYLYGKLACFKQEEVSATELIQQLRRRALGGNEDRVDRLLGPCSGYVVKTGAKRGSGYRLTASGVQFAETLVAKANANPQTKK